MEGTSTPRKKHKSPLIIFLQRFNVTLLVCTLLQHLGSIPIRFQQVVLHTLQPIAFSFVIILFIYLLEYPVIALVPVGFILYEVVMYSYRSKHAEAKRVTAIIDPNKASGVDA